MNNFLDVSYEKNSFVEVGKAIKLNAVVHLDGVDINDEKWESLNPQVATVDQNGNVLGIKKGVAEIKVTILNEEFKFFVRVIDEIKEGIIKDIIDNHYSNALTVYNLGIDSGIPDYYYDVVSSINNHIFQDLIIDKTYYDKLPLNVKNNGLMEKVEFICVHYTGNPHFGADADNNCSYFNNLEYLASIHFVTGRTNLYRPWNNDDYMAFAGLSEKYAGWHASDTKQGPHKWLKTGVMVTTDNEPIISINENSYFTINGIETLIKVPEREDGIKITGPTFIYEGKTCQSINKQGIACKVIDGEYYLGNTWWGHQQYGKTLCNIGGNYNSIGIESCIDIGSNLWHTWQITAKLVAKLLVDYNLGFDRVVGHHYFSGKDCPQPFLENNSQLWNVFMQMVKFEYALLTKYQDLELELEIKEGSSVADKYGLIRQTDKPVSVLANIIIKKDGKVIDSVILPTIVESNLKYDGKREKPSLQNIGYEII